MNARIIEVLERVQGREISINNWDVPGNGGPKRWTFKGRLDSRLHKKTVQSLVTII